MASGRLPDTHRAGKHVVFYFTGNTLSNGICEELKPTFTTAPSLSTRIIMGTPIALYAVPTDPFSSSSVR